MPDAPRVKIEQRKEYGESEWSDKMPLQVPVWRVVSGFLAGVVISGLIAPPWSS